MGFFDFLKTETQQVQNTEFQIKVELLPQNDEISFESYGIFIKGDPWVTSNVNHTVLMSLIDATDANNMMPILYGIESHTDPINRRNFYQEQDIGNMYRKLWPEWSQVGIIFPDFLTCAYKGKRLIMLRLWIWESLEKKSFFSDISNRPKSPYNCLFKSARFELDIKNTGYKEANEEKIKVQEAAIKLAVSIAYADGSFGNMEGSTIKKWTQSILDKSSPSSKPSLKEKFNMALELSYKDAKSGLLNIGLICDDIRNIGSENDKYELLELCLDVMASDGKADKNELNQIYKIADMIGIDYEEIVKMKDKKILLLDPSSYSSNAMEEKIGIMPGWTSHEINQHIIKQYAKWNGRYNSLQDGKEKNNAQAMLDLLGEARKKYS